MGVQSRWLRPGILAVAAGGGSYLFEFDHKDA